MGGPASSIPRVAPTEAEWTQDIGQALVQGRGEHVQSNNTGMSAMMVILKLCRVRQDTLSSVLDEAGKAMAAQHKFRLRALKYRRRADACGRAQQEVEEIRGITNYHLQQWGQTACERDELHNQLMNLTIVRDEAAQELDRVTRHRDAALELAEERRQGWIMANHNAFQRGARTPRAA